MTTHPGPQAAALTALLSLFLCCAGCGGEPDATDNTPTDASGDTTADAGQVTCASTADGVCDEPLRCALGSDEADCAAACESGSPTADLWGACEWRRREGEPTWAHLNTPPKDSEPSLGKGGLGGRSMVTLLAPAANGKGQIQRHFSIYVPSTYDPAYPSPLVFYGGGFGDEMYPNGAYTDLERVAEHERAVVVYVQQLYRDFGPKGYRMAWYTYLNAFVGGWDQCPDAPFLVGVVDHVAKRYNIDKRRVFLTGTSRGGAISIQIAFLRPDVFAGFSSHAGYTSGAMKKDTFFAFIETWKGTPMASVLVHGERDSNVKVVESKNLAKLLESKGWQKANMLRTHFRGSAGHQWQTDLLQSWWDYLMARPRGVTTIVERTNPPASLDLRGISADPGRRPSAPLALVGIGASSFEMGRPVMDFGPWGDWKLNETPQHSVNLPDFAIGRDEVTVAQWVEFLQKVGGLAAWHPWQPVTVTDGVFSAEGDPQAPIAGVSWYEARAFCRWHGLVLPTEAQWERAARGTREPLLSGVVGTKKVVMRRHPWDDNTLDCAHANVSHTYSRCADGPLAVGGRSPAGDSTEGVRDLIGNVSEWVRDWHAPYSAGEANAPTGPKTGTYRVARGGSFAHFRQRARVTARDPMRPSARSRLVGFRCAKEGQP